MEGTRDTEKIGNQERWINMLAFMKYYYPSLWNKWSSRIIEFIL
ncbi:MAG TPA: hypothetical protein VF220_06305 [Nitrososphaeraceae archaeon]